MKPWSKKPVIATLGSHSALQIAKGARDEGLHNLIVTIPKSTALYARYPCVNDVLEIESYGAFPSIEKKLRATNAIIVPHGSFVAYLGLKQHKEMNVAYFGNKNVLDWEFDRRKQRKWMEEASIVVPKLFSRNEGIDRPVIIKTFGAAGGSGYMLAKNNTDLKKYIKKMAGKQYILQEYIIGVPMYVHYFYSVMDKRLEILSIDRRYESNADGIGRLPIQHQTGLLEPSYTVVGNSPLSVRESLLPELYAMGERVITASKNLISPQGLFGPFCLEMIIDERQHMYTIEISARIVAGTNLFINGSPYADLFFDVPMSTGRRIAREISVAYKRKQLHKILHLDSHEKK